MNERRKRAGSSRISIEIPAKTLAEIEIRAALAGKDRDAYLIELAKADVAFGAQSKMDHDGVVVMDTAGQIRWVNISFCAMCGYTLVDLFGKQLGAPLRTPTTDPDTVQAFLEAFKHKGRHLGPVLSYHRSRRPYWVCRLLTPMTHGGRHLGFVALDRQISTPATFRPDGPVARQLAARWPRVEKAIRANPEQFGVII